MAHDALNGHDSLRNFLSDNFGPIQHVSHAAPVHGGCINTCVRLETNAGLFFLKYNNADAYPGMMAAEAYGLQQLRSTETIGIPRVVAQHVSNGVDFLVLEWIEAAPEVPGYWEQFGQRLAALHRNTSPTFGLEKDNYIGSLPQRNTPTASGIEFFIAHRLAPQLQLAIDKKQLPVSALGQFENLYNLLESLLPEEPPALLHGDLWSGNFLTGPDGHAWLVDPSVHYGFREAEIAYTVLFGGFDERFYAAYDAAFPLLPGYHIRQELYNIYPLLVHVNLFGGHYAQQVMTVVKKYV